MEIITNQGRKISISNNPLVYRYKGKVIIHSHHPMHILHTKLDKYAEFIDALEDNIFEFIMNNKITYYEKIMMAILASNYFVKESISTDNFKVAYIEDGELLRIDINVYNEHRKLNIIDFTDIIFSLDDRSVRCSEISSDKSKNKILGKYLIGKSIKSALH